MTKTKSKLTFEQAATADEHMRFVLNTTESILGVLGTTVATARHGAQAQPETKRAFDKAVKALNTAYAAVTSARSAGSAKLKARALKDAKP